MWEPAFPPVLTIFSVSLPPCYDLRWAYQSFPRKSFVLSSIDFLKFESNITSDWLNRVLTVDHAIPNLRTIELKALETSMRNRKNAGNQHFVLFSHWFQTY